MTNKCKSIWGHKYQPRYNVVPPEAKVKVSKISSEEFREIYEAMSKKEYVCDVCVRCGDRVE